MRTLYIIHACIHTYARGRRRTNDAGRHMCKRRSLRRRLALTCTRVQNDTGTGTLTWIHTRHFLAAHLQKSMQLGWEPVFPIAPAALCMHTSTFKHTYTTSTNTWQHCNHPHTVLCVCWRALPMTVWPCVCWRALPVAGSCCLPPGPSTGERAGSRVQGCHDCSAGRRRTSVGCNRPSQGLTEGGPNCPPPLGTSRARGRRGQTADSSP